MNGQIGMCCNQSAGFIPPSRFASESVRYVLLRAAGIRSTPVEGSRHDRLLKYQIRIFKSIYLFAPQRQPGRFKEGR